MTQGKRRLVTEAGRANPVRSVHVWTPRGHPGLPLVVVTHLDVYATIHQHGVASLPNETGGFLLGRVSFDAQGQTWLVEIDEALPVDPGQQDPVHFSFDWRDVDRVRTYRQERDKALIGWYHTHPALPLFLSETDLDRAHRVLFAEPFQVALVYDPVRGRAGYFYWEAPQTIDPTQADWREFVIAVQDEGQARDADAQTPPLPLVVESPGAGQVPEEPAPADGPNTPVQTHIETSRLPASELERAASAEPSTPPMGTPAAAAANAMARAALEGVPLVAVPPKSPTPPPAPGGSSTAQVPGVTHVSNGADEPRTLMMTSSYPEVATTPAPMPVPQSPTAPAAVPVALAPPASAAAAAPSRRWMMILLVIALVSLGFSAGLVAMLMLGKLRF